MSGLVRHKGRICHRSQKCVLGVVHDTTGPKTRTQQLKMRPRRWVCMRVVPLSVVCKTLAVRPTRESRETRVPPDSTTLAVQIDQFTPLLWHGRSPIERALSTSAVSDGFTNLYRRPAEIVDSTCHLHGAPRDSG